MKQFIKSICILSAVFFMITSYAQEKAKILKYPKDWRYERINFPLDFAKNIDWEGFEELRFSPGMFDVKSPDYFTYYFVLSIKKVEISIEEIKEALIKYYKGLCKAVNVKEKFKINHEEITVTIEKISSCSLKANVVFFDGFTDGRRIVLDMLIEVSKVKDTEMLLLTSVTPSGNAEKLDVLHKNNIKHNLSTR